MHFCWTSAARVCVTNTRVDIFAVFQNFKGDFKDHPDSDFPGVIRASQGVLFTIMPWRAPLCVERVWWVL